MGNSKLLIATTNSGKLREYRQMLSELPFEMLSLTEAGIDFDVEETGATFAENALLKAKTYASLSGLLTLADDSGLEVDALNGNPGVLSARYAVSCDNWIVMAALQTKRGNFRSDRLFQSFFRYVFFYVGRFRHTKNFVH